MSLQEKYQKQVIPAMKKNFGCKNDLAAPKIVKVVINVGIGKFRENDKAVEDIQRSLASITGQQPVFTLAKQSIANFKTRKGMKVGMKVTLRGKRMYDFLERLIGFALPRSRDFRGLNAKIIDLKGNLAIGVKEHIIFPEISHEEVKTIFGLEVCIATNAKNREEGLELFRLMGFPIKR
ncbi:MAG: 50S ribosomal protein L5 [Candidatus Portnoybacteria bacterium]|nr:50S ribosomal protein L5 [Candidatus Portnoybacteria bacterium]